MRFLLIAIILLLTSGVACAANESDTIKEIKAAEFTAKFNTVNVASLQVSRDFIVKHGHQMRLRAVLEACDHTEFAKTFAFSQKKEFEFISNSEHFVAAKKQYNSPEFIFDIYARTAKYLNGYVEGYKDACALLTETTEDFCPTMLENAKNFMDEKIH